jgi:hypothetical protein
MVVLVHLYVYCALVGGTSVVVRLVRALLDDLPLVLDESTA